MKISFRKQPGVDIWVLWKDDEKTNYTLSREKWGTDVYYLLRIGKKVIRRYSDRNECIEDVRVMFLDKEADRILGGK